MQQTTFPEHDFRVEKVAAPLRHGVTESIRYAIALGPLQERGAAARTRVV